MLSKPLTFRCLACGLQILPSEGLWIQQPDGSTRVTSYAGVEELLAREPSLARVLHVRCAAPIERGADVTRVPWHRARRRAA